MSAPGRPAASGASGAASAAPGACGACGAASAAGWRVAVIGGGPAGLMAAETLAIAGLQVDLYDAMPSVGRKFLLAGRGGLNLTHSEPLDAFVRRYGARGAVLESMLRQFGPAELRAWALALGVGTFVGSSGRVFPIDMKAAPLLRAWLHRLRGLGVRFHMRHRWLGWTGNAGGAGADTQALRFAGPAGEQTADFDAVLLALGGASWARLGSDGAWVPLLATRGVEAAPLRPSNCGFDVLPTDAARVTPNDTNAVAIEAMPAGWTEYFRSRHAGKPLKNVALALAGDAAAGPIGEFVVTDHGIEGSLVYAISARARDQLERLGTAVLHLDLLPARSAAFVALEVARPRGSRSLSTHLKSRLGLDGVKAALLLERLPGEVRADPARLAQAIKALPLALRSARPIDEAISSAGGVPFEALDDGLMLRDVPGVHCAGEMLDWEAPTGGYLLTACMASGRAAALGVLRRAGLAVA